MLIAKIEKALAGLERRIVEGQFKDCDKMLLRLGRIRASHLQVVDLHELAVKDSKEGPRLIWRQKPEQQQWLEAREICLRRITKLDGEQQRILSELQVQWPAGAARAHSDLRM